MSLKKINTEFENIVLLIQEARNSAFSKVNAELVLLYFNVGKIVSEKVTEGVWGEGTVNELADYIKNKVHGMSGFTRRGLYRMKQFYETYSVSEFVLPMAALLQTYFKNKTEAAKVSALPTQLQDNEFLHGQFVSAVLTQISWANHLEILSATKSPEEKFFYLLHCIKEKWSMRELRRQLSTGYFERTMLSNTIVPAVQAQLPTGLFKDPYIFEFLNLPEAHSENDLEKALIKT